MASDLGRCVLPDIDFSEAVLLDFHKMAVTLSVLWITAATIVMLRRLKKQHFQRDMGLRRVW
jgi:hypothetical protein